MCLFLNPRNMKKTQNNQETKTNTHCLACKELIMREGQGENEIYSDKFCESCCDKHRLEALEAYAYIVGDDYFSIEGFEDSYQGEYESDEDFAQELAEQTDDIPKHLWSYIDWEFYARELMYDYSEHDGFYFRSI